MSRSVKPSSAEIKAPSPARRYRSPSLPYETPSSTPTASPRLVTGVILPFKPDPGTVDNLELAGYELAYMIIAKRHTDLFQ
jgi:hypothetical protein